MAHHIATKGDFDLNKMLTLSLVHSETSRNAALTDDEEPFQKVVLKHIGLKDEQVLAYSSHPFKSFLEEYEYNFQVRGGFTKIAASWQKPIYEGLEKQQCRIKLSGFAGDELVSNSGTKWYYEGFNQFDLRFILSFLSEAIWPRAKMMVSYCFNRIFPSRNDLKVRPENDYLSKQYHHWLLKSTHRGIHKSYKSYLTSIVTRPFTTLRMEAEMLHAMRHNAECRYPMTDIRLLEFVLSVPYPLFEPLSEMKRILFRNSLRDILPTEILERPGKTTAAMPYFSDKNQKQNIDLGEILELLSFENFVFIDVVKMERQLKNAARLKKDSDLDALLNTIFLNIKQTN